MYFYVGCIDGSGCEFDTKEKFLEYLMEQIEFAEEQGETFFDIEIVKWGLIVMIEQVKSITYILKGKSPKECKFGGDTNNNCEDCIYSGDYYFDKDNGECVLRN